MKRPPFDPTFAKGGLFDFSEDADAPKPKAEAQMGSAGEDTAKAGATKSKASKPIAVETEAQTETQSAVAQRPLQVSEAAQLLDDRLASLGKLAIEGEVGGYRGANNSGHLYFSIKDSGAVISCVVWKSRAASIKVPLAEGLKIVIEGRFNYYAEGGRLSFIVESIRATGQGDLDAKFRQLCAELKQLGYFEEARKRPLPMLPRGIAIITSASGAALQDCLAVAARRFPSVPIFVIDVVVQGLGAAAAVSGAIRAVDLAARRLRIDAILVTRGGGSREDLEAFNDRLIADAVFHCATPVVAAIGHESDTSIIELVADLRASTPTAAMNRLLPDRGELRQQLEYVDSSLRQAVLQFCSAKSLALSQMSSRPCLRDPARLLQLPAARLDLLAREISNRMLSRIERTRRTTLELSGRLDAVSPASTLARSQARSQSARQRLLIAMKNFHSTTDKRLVALESQLRAVGPQGTLSRGYSITRSPDGKLLRSVAQARAGEIIHTVLIDGEIRSRIEKGG
ncbi:MAG: exodeoxyribonuclease VII large subunit [Planctomycetes bacterium]|nr:exodeoxyribonuclease VII large subunit [Planctomycetota bacterium]